MRSEKKPLQAGWVLMTNAFVDTSVILRLLVKDDDLKMKAAEKLLRHAGKDGIILHLTPVTILEIVWVLEKVYKLKRKEIRELAEAIMNTPQLKVELEETFRKAVRVYEENNVKFADAVMGYWGLERGITTVFTYDEKDFKRIEGLTVKKP
jgi:predicted nucleic-acid-binding protein